MASRAGIGCAKKSQRYWSAGHDTCTSASVVDEKTLCGLPCMSPKRTPLPCRVVCWRSPEKAARCRHICAPDIQPAVVEDIFARDVRTTRSAHDASFLTSALPVVDRAKNRLHLIEGCCGAIVSSWQAGLACDAGRSHDVSTHVDSCRGPHVGARRRSVASSIPGCFHVIFGMWQWSCIGLALILVDDVCVGPVIRGARVWAGARSRQLQKQQ